MPQTLKLRGLKVIKPGSPQSDLSGARGRLRTRLFFAYVTTSVPYLIPLEMRGSDALGRLGLLATFWQRSLIAMLRMETIINVAFEPGSAMEPRPGANKHVAGKPFRTIIAGRSTRIRSGIIVTIGAFGCRANFDADLSICLRSGYRRAESSNGC